MGNVEGAPLAACCTADSGTAPALPAEPPVGAEAGRSERSSGRRKSKSSRRRRRRRHREDDGDSDSSLSSDRTSETSSDEEECASPPAACTLCMSLSLSSLPRSFSSADRSHRAERRYQEGAGSCTQSTETKTSGRAQGQA